MVIKVSKGSDKLKMTVDEGKFQKWYNPIAKERGLNPDPDAKGHHYDYRAAFVKGQGPDKTGHWPSENKSESHPRKIVNGVNTITGKNAK